MTSTVALDNLQYFVAEVVLQAPENAEIEENVGQSCTFGLKLIEVCI